MLTNEILEQWKLEAGDGSGEHDARVLLLIEELNEAQETICGAAKLLCDACPEIRAQMGERLVELLDGRPYGAAA